MKDGDGRFASFTLGVANSTAQNTHTHTPKLTLRDAHPPGADTRDFKVRSDGSHVAGQQTHSLFKRCLDRKTGGEMAEMNSNSLFFLSLA